MASQQAAIKEVVPKSGLLFQEITLHPVLCKPKIMQLKSVTLEKLEKMQKQAQDKTMEMEKNARVNTARPTTTAATPPEAAGSGPVLAQEQGKADVWRAEDDDGVPNQDED